MSTSLFNEIRNNKFIPPSLKTPQISYQKFPAKYPITLRYLFPSNILQDSLKFPTKKFPPKSHNPKVSFPTKNPKRNQKEKNESRTKAK